MKCTLALAALLIAVSSLAHAADCSPEADEVNAKCYPGNLQAAVDAALTTDRPLVMPRGTYPISKTLVIDYSAHPGAGFELISRGAIIDGTGIQNTPAVEITCASDCFYFHQEGTLFVNANTTTYALVVGKPDFSDAHNSIKLDHLIVNNANNGPSAGGMQLNYVLNADMFVVADVAGAGNGLALEQVQFSTIRGAASATNGAALAIENGYSFADTFTSLDLEVSKTCWLITSIKASHCPLHQLPDDRHHDPRGLECVDDHIRRDFGYDGRRYGDGAEVVGLGHIPSPWVSSRAWRQDR